MDPEAANILHDLSRRASWSRANEKGVFPGVATPLNWSIWGDIGERGTRRAAFELGLLAEHELAIPADADDRMWSIFYGRPTANIDSWRMLYERGATAEGDGSASQRAVFGDAAADARPLEVVDRRSEIEARRPVAIRETAPRLRSSREEMEQWWRRVTRPEALSGREACKDVFSQAVDRFARVDPDHIVVSLLATDAVTQITSAAEATGRPELANALMVGYPGMEEFRTTVALWDLARGTISLDEFLAEHGFHGPHEGEIASRPWRERPSPVLALAERFRTLPETDDPRRREAEALERRQALEAELRRLVESENRAVLDEALSQAEIFLPLREAGRATLTLALDAMRASARRLAAEYIRDEAIGHVEDIFLLTRFELLDLPSDVRDLVAERRALRAHYERFDLPESWSGMPDKLPIIPRADAAAADGEGRALVSGDRLEGLGASAGVHEGLARVVYDSEQLADAFEPGDVLVAPATDPSWAPFFLIAGAVVIDTGSNISHAAVVAREMGIPAVVSVREASQRLVTGQRLRVDGGKGLVEILD